MQVSIEISSLKGVGPKLNEKLNKCGIFTILDLLLYFPRDYEFIRANIAFEEIDGEEKQILSCRVKGFDNDIRTRTGKYISGIKFEYDGHIVEGKWFNQRFIKNSFKIGQNYDLVGKFKKIGNRLEIINPIIGCAEAKSSEIIPRYSLKGDLSDKILIKLINQVMTDVIINDNLPKELIEKYNLIGLDEAIRNIHFPKGKVELENAIVRLKFQELFTYSMKLLLLKNKVRSNDGIRFKLVDELTRFKVIATI